MWPSFMRSFRSARSWKLSRTNYRKFRKRRAAQCSRQVRCQNPLSRKWWLKVRKAPPNRRPSRQCGVPKRTRNNLILAAARNGSSLFRFFFAAHRGLDTLAALRDPPRSQFFRESEMANTKSAGKRARQTAVRSIRNRSVLTRLRKMQKGIAAKPETKDVRAMISAIDKAAKRGIIHKNAAKRRKARLNKLVIGAAPAAAYLFPPPHP